MPDAPSEHPESPVYPELRLFASSDEATAAIHEARMGIWRSPRVWLRAVAWLCVPVVTAVSVVAIVRLFWQQVPRTRSALPVIVSIITALVSSLGLRFAFRGPVRRALRVELCKRGVPVCVPCGYDLRGLQTRRCPECGAAFDPGLLERAGAASTDSTAGA